MHGARYITSIAHCTNELLSTTNGGRKIEAFAKRQPIFAQGDSSDMSEIAKVGTIGI
jgi:hypothetical protein